MDGVWRTFGRLKMWVQKYEEDGSPRAKMQEYKNVINKCLLEEEEDVFVIDVVPPPELHLFEHVVTKIADELTKDVMINNFFALKGITRHGYNGGGYDGPNCNKILHNLDEITSLAGMSSLPFIDSLRKFKKGQLFQR